MATKEGKKWKASKKDKLWATYNITSNTATRGTTPNMVYELASLAVAIEKDKSEEVDICLSSTSDHVSKASQLTFNKTLFHPLYS